MKTATEIEMGPFVEVSPHAWVGPGCRLGSHCHVQAGAVLGMRVEVEGGVILHGGVTLEDEVRIGANVVFVRPGAGEGEMRTVVRKGGEVGGNATLAAGVTIGEGAVVKPGAVVVASVQPHAIVAGNPARVIGFQGAEGDRPNEGVTMQSRVGEGVAARVRGVRLFELPFISDPRGNLTVGEFERTIPFRPKRYFMTFDVPDARMRGSMRTGSASSFWCVCAGHARWWWMTGAGGRSFYWIDPRWGSMSRR